MIWQQFEGPSTEWDGLVASLTGCFYQTYGWGEVRRVAGWQPVRLFACQDGQVVSAASVLVKRRLGLAVCWIPGGPLGSRDVFTGEFQSYLRSVIPAKILYCRVSLLRACEEDDYFFLANAGWRRPSFLMSLGQSMSYSLVGEESDRLDLTSSNWRRNLKRSGRYGLSVELWENPDSNVMSLIYNEMERLKSLPPQHSNIELSAIFTECIQNVVVFRCLNKDGRLIAFRAAGVSGTTAMDLLAAAGEEARRVYASHAILWALLGHCSRLGLKYYDLSGVDPVGNKGVYDFKNGTGATLINCVGEWEWSTFPGLSTMVNFLMYR